MASTTTVLGLPFPELADGPPDIAGDIEALAVALDAKIGMAKIAELAPTAGVMLFSSIPATYRHLRLVGQVRKDGTATGGGSLRLKLNAAATGYGARWVAADATAGADGAGLTTSSETTTQSSGALGLTIDETEANAAAGVEVDIPNYRSALWKTWQFRTSQIVLPSASLLAPKVTFGGGTWHNTAAITSVELLISSALLDSVSLVSLYGLR